MLKGLPVQADQLPPEWRDYCLAKLFGWDTEQIDGADAARCDWFLEFAAIEVQISRANSSAPVQAPPGFVAIPVGNDG